jgi:PST family polysaccharide transporter
MTEQKERLFKNVAFLSMVQVANYILPLLSVPIISRILGPEKFGVINYAAVFVTYFSLLISYGFDLTATRKISKDATNEDLRNQVFSEVFGAQFLLFLFSIAVFTICLFLVPPLAIEKKVTIFSFLICISTLFTQNWLFQAMQDLSKVAWMNFLGKLLSTVAILIVIRKQSDYVWQPLVLSVSSILISLLSFIWALRRYKIKIINVSLKTRLDLLVSEKTVFVSMVVISLYTTTNMVMLGLLVDQTDVGYYAAAQKLIFVASSIINVPLAQACFPFIGKAFGEGREKGIQTVQRITPIILLITGTAGVLMFLLGPIALSLFYGPQFEPSVKAFQVMTFVPFIIALSNVFGIQIMLNLKMDKSFFAVTSTGAVLGLVLNYVMIHLWGYIGTAWNWFIVEVYITTAMYVVIRKNGINPFDAKQFTVSAIRTQLIPLLAPFKNKILKR